MNNVSLEDRIIKIIKENFTNPDFNVNKLAEELNINRSYLYKDTIKIFKYNPKHLIAITRISLALELLTKGEKVTYAAYKTGFINSYNLRRAFKTRLNNTPSKIRKQCLHNNDNKEKFLKIIRNSLLK